MPINNTLQRTVNIAQQFLRGAPLTSVLGVANEPALTIGDWVRNIILSPPFAWRWNRNLTIFNTAVGIQDYINLSSSAWQANHAYSVGDMIFDSNQNLEYVVNAGTSGPGPQPTWSTTFGGGVNDNTVTWRMIGGARSLPILTDIGWLEKVSINDTTNSLTGVKELEIVNNLATEVTQNQPARLSYYFDSPSALFLRFSPVPDKIYGTEVLYQKQCPAFSALADTWAPIPDYMSFLYNQGFLAKSYEYFNDDRFVPTMQLFIRNLISANNGLSETQINIFMADQMNTLVEQRTKTMAAGSGRLGKNYQ